jgi:hypothetical protein
MLVSQLRFGVALLASALSASACAQTLNAPGEIKAPVAADATLLRMPAITPAVELLTGFKESEIKFSLNDLMDVLRDRRHEGWVLATYPDPKTSQPLIGAGFSLDLPARDHPQRDPLNPHPFLEPSSAELWQAAGLDPDRLNRILDQFHRRLAAWNKKQFRKRIRTLDPDIREEEANLLLRVGAIQAVYNARAYCRNFDQLTPSQQMALSQLVYQMGVNLEEFNQFLTLINGDAAPTPQQQAAIAHDPAYWTTVQQSLIHSQWARLYRTRAVSVIAMLDPRYEDSPAGAERRIGATLRPAVVHRRRGRGSAPRALEASTAHSSRRAHRSKAHSRSRRKAA